MTPVATSPILVRSDQTKGDDMAAKVSIYDAKTQLSRLVACAEQGEEITITRHGRPVARLVAVGPDRPVRVPGAWRGQVQIAEDFDTMSEADLADWYGA